MGSMQCGAAVLNGQATPEPQTPCPEPHTLGPTPWALNGQPPRTVSSTTRRRATYLPHAREHACIQLPLSSWCVCACVCLCLAVAVAVAVAACTCLRCPC